MSFSSNGVTFNKTKWIRNRIFKFLFRGAEGILSVLFVISLAAPMVFPNHANAAIGVSSKLSYQGRLTDTSGNPYTGTYYVCFSIWDVATGGTANPNQLWPSSFAVPASNTVTVTNGVFNAGVGVADALNFDFSSNDTVYLNVGVSASNVTCDNGAMENLTPRQRLDATPYARVAENLYGGNARIGTGAGVTSNNQKYIHLDKVTGGNAENTGDACPTGSVNGSVWYNSSRTRALMCETNIIKTISLVEGIKEQSVASGSEIKYGVVNLSGSNNITISQTGSTLQFSVPTPVQGFGMSNIGNTLGTSGSGTGTIVLAGGNNITLSQATGAGARTITIIGPAGGGAVLQGSGTYTQNTGTVQFANSYGITFGLSNNGTMTASHNGLTVQSAQPVAISGSNGSFVFSTVSFGNSNGLSFYTTNGSIVGSYTAGAGGGFGSLSAGAQNVTGGTLVFANANGVSFGLNSNANGSHTITASVAAAGGAGVTVNSTVLGNNRGWAQGSVSLGQNSLYVFPQNLDMNVAVSAVKFPVMVTNSSSAFAAHTRGYTMEFGVYTRAATNSTVLTRHYSTSYTAAFSASSNASWAGSIITGFGNSTSYNTITASSAGLNLSSASFHGPRNFILPFNTTLSQGEYWFAVRNSSSSAGAAGNLFNLSYIIASSQTQNRFGVASNLAGGAGIARDIGIGTYSATTGAMPGGISMTQINQAATNPIIYLFNNVTS